MKEAKHQINVLMTTDTVGGVWTYCVELCRSLLNYNVQFTLVTAGAKMQQWQKEEIQALQNVTVFETTYKLEWMNDPWNDVNVCGELLLELEEQLEPDIVHLNSFSFGSLPFKSLTIVIAHSDVYSWWKAVHGQTPPAEWKTYYQRVRNGITGVDLVIAPSRFMFDAIKDIYVDDIEGIVIYNGRNERLFCTAKKKPVVFCMGRLWDEAKNISLVTAAASNINYKIRIAGDNKFDTFQASIENNNVTLLGKLSTSQIANELSTASIYLLPAKYEPFGLSALEAALSGCALVLADIPSLQEIWDDAAVYVDPNNPEELAEKVNSLMGNESLLKNYAAKALSKAKKYSAEIMAENYLSLYERILTQTPSLVKRETV
jgi:glycogen synthase